MNLNFDEIRKISFTNLEEALNNIQGWGGWFFVQTTPSEKVLAGEGSKVYTDKEVTWYNAKYYTQSEIFRDSKGSGMIGMHSYFRNMLKPA